ncbi:MAG: SsrA-binding protein SmpB [Acholeplasmatales bacterium]|nr:SsrA-binding protein SmpB [Acholeplasmatales bacterium]
MKIIASNKKAYHEYFILDTYEAGIVLTGTEIKSIRDSKANINDAYVSIKNNEAFIIGMHIAKYSFGNIFNHKETRDRKLLLHKKEILKLSQKIQLKGLTIIPLKLYIDKGLAKLEIGVCQGKKLYDKREDLKKKDQMRKIESSMKDR